MGSHRKPRTGVLLRLPRAGSGGHCAARTATAVSLAAAAAASVTVLAEPAQAAPARTGVALESLRSGLGAVTAAAEQRRAAGFPGVVRLLDSGEGLLERTGNLERVAATEQQTLDAFGVLDSATSGSRPG